MANLSDDDRGQLILVAAFAIAVIFVSMALIVNSAIFTENLASRGETAGSEGALSMRAMVETNVGDSLRAINRRPGLNHTTIESELGDDIDSISVQTGRQQARSGRIVSVSGPTSHENGTRIFEADPGDTLTSDGNDNYQVVGGVSRVSDGNGTRAFEINASSISASNNGTAFGIVAQETGAPANENSWRAQIWQTTGGTVHVLTLRNDSSGTVATEECAVTPDSADPNIHIDVTGGTIDGEPCDALGTGQNGENFHFAAGTDADPGVTTDTYDISFVNASAVTGNFSMTVHGATTDLTGIGTSMSSEDALYEATVRYTYVTSDLRYETDVRVAPGEPDV